MSTRKLIAIALLCGLAILVAGGIQLLRISDAKDRTVVVLAEGESATVGGISLAVESSARDADEILAEVRFAPSAERVTLGVEHFTLLVGGELTAPSNAVAQPGDCPPTIVIGQEGTRCRLRFAGRDGTATLGFSAAGEQRQWRLEPTGP